MMIDPLGNDAGQSGPGKSLAQAKNLKMIHESHAESKADEHKGIISLNDRYLGLPIAQMSEELSEAKCLVPCDHIPRRSWPLFRAKAMLGELIAGFSSPGLQSHQEQLAA